MLYNKKNIIYSLNEVNANMSPLPKANRDLIRSINRSILLNAIKTEGEISRAALAHRTGLSPATVTAITGQLIQENLIFEKNTGDSTGGRPPIMLALNPRGGFVVGIKLMEDHLVGGLTDLNAAILTKDELILPDKEVNTCVESLASLVDHLVRETGIRKKQLMGVGVGLAGVVNSAEGIVKQNPFFGWKDIKLRDLLQKRLRVPVYIDNDVNTLTLSEKWIEPSQTENNFIVVTVGRGVGMGIVINGQIYRGKAGGAGELGHVIIDPQGPLCSCGRHGCLESLISDKALVEQARLSLDPGINDLDELILRAETQTDAANILGSAGTLLGRQLANLVNIFRSQN